MLRGSGRRDLHEPLAFGLHGIALVTVGEPQGSSLAVVIASFSLLAAGWLLTAPAAVGPVAPAVGGLAPAQAPGAVVHASFVDA